MRKSRWSSKIWWAGFVLTGDGGEAADKSDTPRLGELFWLPVGGGLLMLVVELLFAGMMWRFGSK